MTTTTTAAAPACSATRVVLSTASTWLQPPPPFYRRGHRLSWIQTRPALRGLCSEPQRRCCSVFPARSLESGDLVAMLPSPASPAPLSCQARSFRGAFALARSPAWSAVTPEPYRAAFSCRLLGGVTPERPRRITLPPLSLPSVRSAERATPPCGARSSHGLSWLQLPLGPAALICVARLVLAASLSPSPQPFCGAPRRGSWGSDTLGWTVRGSCSL